MKNILYTYKTLWQDFDETLPCQAEIIRQEESDGVVTKELYFSGRQAGKARPRIFAMLAQPKEQTEARPLILVFGARGERPDLGPYAYLLEAGDVMVVDYCGENGTARRTYYPDDIAYANASVSGQDFMRAPLSAKETAVYEWIAVCRYALRAGRELGYSSVALYGVGEGGNLAIMTAALEEDVVCLVSCFGCGWERYRRNFKHGTEPEPEATEEFARYVAGCEAENYCRSVSCPVLYLSVSNNRDYPLDRAADTLSMLPDAVFSIAPRLSGSFGEEERRNVIPFLRAYLSESGPKPKTPVYRAEITDGELRCRIFEPVEEIERAAVFYAFNEVNPAVRNWREVDCSEGTCTIPVGEGEETAFLYPTVKFRNGYCTSGKFLVVSTDGVKKSRMVCNQVLYNSAMGKDTFTSFCPDLLAGTAGEIRVEEGPCGIFGVTDTRNRLATYKVNDARCRIAAESIHVDLYSLLPQTVYLVVYENYNTGREISYSAEVRALGGELWQPVTLSVKQFKSDNTVLKSFAEVNLLVFVSEEKTLWNNLLWV